MRKESSIVLIRVNHAQGQHPTQVKEKRNVKSKYYESRIDRFTIAFRALHKS